MKPINNDTIDELMFQLLEGEITGSERERLLEAIHADESYLKLWKAWQNTVLQTEDIPFDGTKLKHTKTFIIPYYLKYGAAAIFIFGLLIFLNLTHESPGELSMLPPKIKTFKNPLPQAPSDSVNYHQLVRDTFVPFKEKVKYLAHHSKPRFFNSETTQIDSSVNFVKIIDQENPIPRPVILPAMKEEPKKVNTYEEEIFVNISTEKNEVQEVKKTPSNFLARLIGKPMIKIEPDLHTKSKRKIILENKKYQIIAGF